LIIAPFFVVAGCNEKSQNADVKVETGSPEIKQSSGVQAFDPATAGTISGKVVFEGQAPAPQALSIAGNPECAAMHPGGQVDSEELLVNQGMLQNVFIYIKEGLEGRAFDVPQQAVAIENKGCVYVPHVAGAQVNQPVDLVNSDPTLHNVHTYSKNSKSWNIGLPFQGMKQTKKFSAPEVMVALKCDVHPWMRGYLGILPHPYFGVTGMDGTFELKNLPPGEYVIEAWHEKLGVQSQTVKIEPQETKEVSFSFKTA